MGQEVQVSRSCGNCTKCCDGWLSGNIRGHEVFPGKPCFFVTIGVGCNDYHNRPEIPCKTFVCGWLDDESIPENFKPNIADVMAVYSNINGIDYVKLVEVGNPKIEATLWYINHYPNVWAEIDGKNYVAGSEQFMSEVEKEFSVERFSKSSYSQ